MSSSSSEVTPSPGSVPVSSGQGGAALCLVSGIRDGISGGFMGSIFGFGQGLWKKQGFKGSLKEAGTSAKTFALLSGIHSLVTCFLKKVRGKHDEINAGIAGCATGIVLSIPGTPDAILRSCATFAAFSYIAERFNKPQPAVASPLDHHYSAIPKVPEKGFNGVDVLPPFVLAPSFLESLVSSSREKFVKSTSTRL